MKYVDSDDKICTNCKHCEIFVYRGEIKHRCTYKYHFKCKDHLYFCRNGETQCDE